MKNITIISLLSLATLLAGCGKQAPQPASGPQAVSVRLQWFDTAQFAGLYVAQDDGLYAKGGLKVDLRPGGPDLNAITLVSAGSDTFGLWTADHILISQSKGVPVTMIAAIYREDPNVLMVKANSNIQSPKDFVGKTITTVAGRSTEIVLRALLARAGISEKQVTIEPFPFNIQSFLDGKVDVSAAYSYDHPFQARKAGQEVRIIRPVDYGIRFYSDVIFARNDLIEKNPDLVQRFVSASLKGWEEALTNRDLALDSVMKRAKGLDKESQAYMLEKSEPLIKAEDPNRIGFINPESIQAMANILKEQKLLPQDFDPAKSFTNRFVEGYYKSAPASK